MTCSPVSFPRWLRTKAPDAGQATTNGYADLVADLAGEVARDISSGGIRRCPRTAAALRRHLENWNADEAWLDAVDLAAIEYAEHLAADGHPSPRLGLLDAAAFSEAIADLVRSEGTAGVWHASPREVFAAGLLREVEGWPHTFAGFAERFRRTGWAFIYTDLRSSDVRRSADDRVFMVDDRDEVGA